MRLRPSVPKIASVIHFIHSEGRTLSSNVSFRANLESSFSTLVEHDTNFRCRRGRGGKRISKKVDSRVAFAEKLPIFSHRRRTCVGLIKLLQKVYAEKIKFQVETMPEKAISIPRPQNDVPNISYRQLAYRYNSKMVT